MSIIVDNISISLAGFSSQPKILVDQASLVAPSGKISTIIGQNGAGKSTLLKAIIGDYVYNKGTIQINHKEHTQFDQQNKARSIAFLPQLSLLNFPFTVEEVVNLGRIPHKTGYKIDRQIIEECLETVDMQHYRRRFYPQLSGGEKQRVQIARVLAQIWRIEDSEESRVMILDEPISSLDLGHQRQLMQFLRMFCQQNVTVLMVLHDVNTAVQYSDHLITMKNGKVLYQGDTNAVFQKNIIDEIFSIDCRIIDEPITKTKLLIHV